MLLFLCIVELSQASFNEPAKNPAGMNEFIGVDNCSHPHWLAVKKSLDLARGHYGASKYGEAIKILSSIYESNYADPFVAFDCATALASVTHLLSACYSKLGHSVKALRAAQATSIFASFDYQMKGQQWIDSSLWGIKWEDTISNVLMLMTEFQGLDSKRGFSRHNSLKDSINVIQESKRSFEKPKVAIVSVCDYDNEITPLGELSKLNKDWYARNNGYDLYLYDKSPFFQDAFTIKAKIASSRPPAWGKIDAVLEVMSKGEHDWVMWMDCDSFFMDDGKLEDIISLAISERGQQDSFLSSEHDRRAVISQRKWKPPRDGADIKEVVDLFDVFTKGLLSGRNESDLMIIASEDGLMLNTGIFFARNHPWSFWFFQKVRQFTFSGNPVTFHSWWEQTAMVYLLSFPFVGQPNTTGFDNIGFAQSVHMLTQRHVNGYPPIVASMLKTHQSFTEGDFIVSFSGCRVYSSQAMCNMIFVTYFCYNKDLCSMLSVDLLSRYFPF